MIRMLFSMLAFTVNVIFNITRTRKHRREEAPPGTLISSRRQLGPNIFRYEKYGASNLQQNKTNN